MSYAPPKNSHRSRTQAMGLCCALLFALAGAVPRCSAQDASPASAPATQLLLPEGPLQLTIEEVRGLVRVRTAPDQPWQKAEAGAVYGEGTEFRTGPKSAVRFTIPPDQTITLDRLGTVKILKSSLESGKIFTDLGMKYGRTRIDIEGAAREHDAKVRSPSSVLAIRGTDVISEDQPPFAPRAVSLTGRAMFRDTKKLVSVGSKGGSRVAVSADSDSPAQLALGNTAQLPRGQFSGPAESDTLALFLGGSGRTNLQNLGVLSLLDRARQRDFSLLGSLVVEQLNIGVTWAGVPGADVDLSVLTPRGDVLSPASLTGISGGIHQGNGIAGENGFGFESVTFPVSYPKGTYQITTTLVNGGAANVNVVLTAQQDPEGRNNNNHELGPGGLPFQFVLNGQTPAVTNTITPQAAPPKTASKVQAISPRAKNSAKRR